jgi:hypothetical protein
MPMATCTKSIGAFILDLRYSFEPFPHHFKKTKFACI